MKYRISPESSIATNTLTFLFSTSLIFVSLSFTYANIEKGVLVSVLVEPKRITESLLLTFGNCKILNSLGFATLKVITLPVG